MHGDIPVKPEYTALNKAIFWDTRTDASSSGVHSDSSALSCVFGMKYSRPGRTSLTELTIPEICLMLSMIIFLSSQNMILLCFPISSMIRYFLHKSPSSFKCSSSKRTMRSSPGCVTATMRAFCKCFLNSMQKLGAVIGLVLFLSVRYNSGRDASADISILTCPQLPFMVKSSSSFSG